MNFLLLSPGSCFVSSPSPSSFFLSLFPCSVLLCLRLTLYPFALCLCSLFFLQFPAPSLYSLCHSVSLFLYPSFLTTHPYSSYSSSILCSLIVSAFSVPRPPLFQYDRVIDRADNVSRILLRPRESLARATQGLRLIFLSTVQSSSKIDDSGWNGVPHALRLIRFQRISVFGSSTSSSDLAYEAKANEFEEHIAWYGPGNLRKVPRPSPPLMECR